MKRLLLFILFAFPVAATAQAVNLKVKNVGIGTSYSDALKQLGKPLSKKKGGSYPCDGGPMITLRYAGLIVKLLESNNNKRNFFVGSVELNSRKWTSSGIKIGANI